jgi:putative phosphoribosyl transferase
MFADRHDAGRQLAERLEHVRNEQPIVLALPRGGVVVAAEIARALDAPLDVLVVRKLGAPHQPELAIGAVLCDDPPRRIHNEELIRLVGATDEYLAAEEQRQLAEARRRLELYRRGRPGIDLANRTAIVVDDGVATGATMAAALAALQQIDLRRLVLAVPVGSPDSMARLRGDVDELVCLAAPPDFRAVGMYYRSFTQTSDDEVVRLLDDARAPD